VSTVGTGHPLNRAGSNTPSSTDTVGQADAPGVPVPSSGAHRPSARAGATLDCRPVAPGLEHSVRVQLRWRDMDMLGHLNQSVFHELLEEGRVALIAELMRRAGDEEALGGYVMVHVDLDYHAEVRKDHGEVEIIARVGRVGTSSVELVHEVKLPDGTLAASGTSVLVAWDVAARTKRPLYEGERAALI
jgi:acyl-CoA thioester hydrolase